MHPAISNLKNRLDVLAERAGVPPPAMYAGAGVAATVALSLAVGLLAGAGQHQPAVQPAPTQTNTLQAPSAAPAAPHQPAVVQRAPAPASAPAAAFSIPPVPQPPELTQGVNGELDFLAKGEPPQKVGVFNIDAQTASFNLTAPPALSGFVPQGKQIQLVYTGYFHITQPGPYILFSRISGPQNAGMIAQINDRADPVLAAERSVSIWDTTSPAPTQSNSVSIYLQSGVYKLTIVVQTTQPQQNGAGTLDLFIKGPSDTVPEALQMMRTAETAQQPVNAASAPAGNASTPENGGKK